VIVVANLKPAKLKGIESQGMLLAAEKNGKVALLEAPKSNLNDRAIFKEGAPAAEVTIDEFAKLKITIKGKKVLLDKLVLKTGAEEVKANVDDGAAVK
jgi:tRNA-binding EMAP/Myf-like protein